MMICSVCDRKRSLSVHTSLPVCLQNKVTLQSAPVGLSAAQRVQNASYTNKQERSLSLSLSLFRSHTLKEGGVWIPGTERCRSDLLPLHSSSQSRAAAWQVLSGSNI